MSAFNGQWAVVELMGHTTRAGQISEVEIFGAKMLRIDIPKGGDGPETFTEIVGGASIYRLSLCSEEVARAKVKSHGMEPVGTPWRSPYSYAAIAGPQDEQEAEFEEGNDGAEYDGCEERMF